MKKINFLGIPVNIMDDEDVAQAADQGQVHHYIMVRVADADPNVGTPDLRRRRLRTPCEKCDEICWFDPKSFDSMAGMNMVMLCAQCFMAEVKNNEENQNPGRPAS